jgi:TPR repeat protein
MEGKVDCTPEASVAESTKDEMAELAEFIQHSKGAAEAGDVVAQNQLGDLYYEGGPGIERNFEEAMVWYSRAAAHGNIDAIYSVAWAYFSGEGVLQSFSDAAVWFEKAVAHCHKKACRNLGKILYFGLGGVPQHVDRGRKLWEQAADLGDAEAAAIIGKLYMEGDTHTPANTEAGVKFLQIAAEQDDGYSMFLLACCYRDGQGVEKNETRALMWFESAREAGFVDVEELYQAALAHHRYSLDLLYWHKSACFLGTKSLWMSRSCTRRRWCIAGTHFTCFTGSKLVQNWYKTGTKAQILTLPIAAAPAPTTVCLKPSSCSWPPQVPHCLLKAYADVC